MTGTNGGNGHHDQEGDEQTQPAAAPDETPEPPLDVAALRRDNEFIERLAAGIVWEGSGDELTEMLSAWVAQVRPEEVVLNIYTERSDEGVHANMRIRFRPLRRSKPKKLRKRMKKALRRILGRVRRILRKQR